MADRNDSFIDILKAIGFVVAVVVGGLFVAGVIDGWNEARDETEATVEDAPISD